MLLDEGPMRVAVDENVGVVSGQEPFRRRGAQLVAVTHVDRLAFEREPQLRA